MNKKCFSIMLALIGLCYLKLAFNEVEHTSSREFQTASSARAYYHDGIDLLRPKLDIYPEPNVAILEFPIYQGLVAATANVLGFSLTLGRVFSVFFLFLSLWFFGRLLQALKIESSVIYTAILLVALNPWFIFHGFRFSIEPMGNMLIVASIFYGHAWLEQQQTRAFYAWALIGLMAGLMKSFYVLPISGVALGLIFFKRPIFQNKKTWVQFCLAQLAWLSALIAWNWHASSTNALVEIPWLVDQHEIVIQQFGDLSARLRWDLYGSSLEHFGYMTFFGLTLIPIVWGIIQAKQQAPKLFNFGLLWLAACLAAFYLFFSVSSTHSYYKLMAIYPISAFAAYGLVSLVSMIAGRAKHLFYWVAGAALSALLVVGLALQFEQVRIYALKGFKKFSSGGTRDQAFYRQADYIQSQTRPDEVVAVATARGTYYPEIAYLSERKMYVLDLPQVANEEHCRLRNHPNGLVDACLPLLKRHHVHQVFVVFRGYANEPSLSEVKQRLSTMPLRLIHTIETQTAAGSLLHYEI